MMVLLSHYANHWMSNLAWVGFASTGVDLFFVLSGYVFAPYILSHKPLTWTSHLVRRFFRLYPLYLTALLVYALQRGGMSETWVEFTRHLFMAHTLGGLDTAFYFNPAFWSLPPEVEFYLFMPLVIWLVKRFGAWPVFVAAALARLALVAPGTSGIIEITARAISTVHLPGLLVEFMVGVLVFQQSQHSAKPVGRGLVPSRRLPWLACVGLAAALGLYGWAIAPGPAHTATLPAVITGNIRYGGGACLWAGGGSGAHMASGKHSTIHEALCQPAGPAELRHLPVSQCCACAGHPFDARVGQCGCTLVSGKPVLHGIGGMDCQPLD